MTVDIESMGFGLLAGQKKQFEVPFCPFGLWEKCDEKFSQQIYRLIVTVTLNSENSRPSFNSNMHPYFWLK